MLQDAVLAYFDDHPCLALLLDGDGRVLRMSARLRQAAGFADTTELEGALADYVDPAARAALDAFFDALVDPGSHVRVSFGLSSAHGAGPVFSWDFRRSRDGKTIFGVASEPIENNPSRLENNMFARENNVLQNVVDHMPVVLWATDEHGIFTLSDGQALAVLGLQPGQVVGMNALELYASEPLIVRTIQEALAGRFSCTITSAGGYKWESRFIPFKRPDGTTRGVIGFAMDVTDRIKAEEELQRKISLVDEQELAIRSLSTPIMRVWDGILALPLVGVLDSTRMERILSSLLEAVVHDQAEYVILDLTGISTVDHTTADHIFKVLRALALLGTQAIQTGIQPAVARALVEIGLDLGQVMTFGNLEEALRFVMKQRRTKGAGGVGKQ
jgi:rsbT co-antagonist protein RsbR